MSNCFDDIPNDQAESEACEQYESCPVCNRPAFVKLVSPASFWVSCDRCGDFDITPDCRDYLCRPPDAEIAGTGLCDSFVALTAGQLAGKLGRYLSETTQTEGRIVSSGPLSRLPEGASVPILLGDVAGMYEPTSDFEADYQAALEAWRATGQQPGHQINPGLERCIFPFNDTTYCVRLLGEMVLRGAAARTIDGAGYCLTVNGRGQPLHQPQKSEGEPEPSPPEVASVQSEANILRKAGRVWELRFQSGKVIHMPHRQGLAYIQHLIRQRGKPIRCDVLYRLVNPPPSQQARLADEDLATLSSQPQGVVLGIEYGDDDPELARVYRQGLEELEARKARTARRNDLREIQSLTKEIADLKKVISSMFGKDGRTRERLDPLKKQRQAVAVAIGTVIKELDSDCPTLARHLEAALRVGTDLMYAPADDIAWTT